MPKGKLYESVGLNKQSAILVLDENTGETLETYPMASKYFGEGLTYYKGLLIQLTYKARKGFMYDVNHLDSPPREFDFDTTTKEGWGFTYDEKRDELIVSDGSAFLHFWDPTTFQQKRKHQIMRLDGTPAIRINELEYWRDRVVANVWFEHVLLIINPVSGLVEKEYGMFNNNCLSTMILVFDLPLTVILSAYLYVRLQHDLGGSRIKTECQSRSIQRNFCFKRSRRPLRYREVVGKYVSMGNQHDVLCVVMSW